MSRIQAINLSTRSHQITNDDLRFLRGLPPTSKAGKLVAAIQSQDLRLDQALKKITIAGQTHYLSADLQKPKAANDSILDYSIRASIIRQGDQAELALFRNSDDAWKFVPGTMNQGRTFAKGNPFDPNLHYVQSTKLPLTLVKALGQNQTSKAIQIDFRELCDNVEIKHHKVSRKWQSVTHFDAQDTQDLNRLDLAQSEFRLQSRAWQNIIDKSRDLLAAHMVLNTENPEGLPDLERHNFRPGSRNYQMLSDLYARYPELKTFGLIKEQIDTGKIAEGQLSNEHICQLTDAIVQEAYTEADRQSGFFVDFANSNPVSHGEIKTSNGKTVQLEEYRVSSREGDQISWLMASDDSSNTWVYDLYPCDSPSNKFGLRRDFLNAGLLVYKFEDHEIQCAGLRDEHKELHSNDQGLGTGAKYNISKYFRQFPHLQNYKTTAAPANYHQAIFLANQPNSQTAPAPSHKT